MASGRENLKKYDKLLKTIEVISKFIPKFIFKILWVLNDTSELRISLLIRYLFVKKYAESCGENIFIGKYVTIKNVERLKLGSNISIHAYCYIDAFGQVTIKDNVSIANHCTLVSFNHTWELKNNPIKYNPVMPGPIIIQEDVWIGSGCRVLSNLIIGSRCVVAAGAVVNVNVDSNTIVGGVPSRVLKEI